MNRRDWATEAPRFGAWLSTVDPFVAEIIAEQGYDYVTVDLQHGLAGQQSAVDSIRAIQARGVVALVRVPSNNPADIARALDAGAAGVVVPLVNSAEEAQRAASATRYPPRGDRSYGPTRVRLLEGTGDPRRLEDVLCIVQVETAEAMQELEAIASVPGVDGIYIGPSDLALSFGEEPSHPSCHQTMAPRIDEIRDACLAHGLAVGIHCIDGATARDYAARGYSLITTIVDTPLITRAAAAELATARTS